MLTKRIIPCLDIKDGKTVKGINFNQLIDAGDPVELAKRYSDGGADELVFLDISATAEKRKTLLKLVTQVAQAINIPFTVGGGINCVADVSALLNAGADKVSVNSAAVKNPILINEIAAAFGSQCLVLAIDAKQLNSKWIVHLVGGTEETKLSLFDWAQEGVSRGAGEILFTSMNGDGTKQGFADDCLNQLTRLINVPIIASGGAGNADHFTSVFKKGGADAALAASVFHFNEINIIELKKHLQQQQIPIRL